MCVVFHVLCAHSHIVLELRGVAEGSLSRGGDVVVYVKGINQPSLPTPFFFHYFNESVTVFMAHLTVFHVLNSPDNSPLSHSVLPVLILFYWSFQL